MRTSLLLLAGAWLLALTSLEAHAQVSVRYDGDTSVSPTTWTRPTLYAGVCSLSDVGVDVAYDVQGFLTDAFDVEFGTRPTRHWIESDQDFDGVMLLYDGTFDAATPCDNLIAETNTTTLDADLLAGTYVVVTTGYATGDAGTFTNKLYTTDSNADLRFDDAPPLSTTALPYRFYSDLWFRPSIPVNPGDCASEFDVLPAYVAQAFETDTDGRYDIHSEQFEFPFLWDGVLYLYEDAFFPFDPCRNLVAADDDYPTGYFWRASLIDDVRLEAGTRYVLVTTVFDDEDFFGEFFGDHDNTIWGPSDATVTLLNDPIPDLELEIVAMPDAVQPGSDVIVDVRVANNSGVVQRVDAWVELRRFDFDAETYAADGRTQADPVRIPSGFDGVVPYALHVPRRLTAGEDYYAVFQLGTYVTQDVAGDLTPFRVAESAASGRPATSAAWTLQRLDTLDSPAIANEALADAAGASDGAADAGAYPNPFNPATTIRFTLEAEAAVTLAVYDVTGREVARLLHGTTLDAGTHAARFDATGLASGVYVYRLTTGGAVTTGRMTLLK